MLNLPPPNLPENTDPSIIKVIRNFYDDDEELLFLLWVAQGHGTFTPLPQWYVNLGGSLFPALRRYTSSTIQDRLKLYQANGITAPTISPQEIDKTATATAAEVAKGIINQTTQSLNSLLQQTDPKDLKEAVAKKFQQFDKTANAVADNATFTAIHEGQRYAAKRAGITKLVWEAVEGACAFCASMDGTVFSADDIIPCPAHMNCRCGLREIIE